VTPILPLFLLLKRQTGPITGVFNLVFSSDGEWPPRKREENLCVIATATGDVPTKATSFGRRGYPLEAEASTTAGTN